MSAADQPLENWRLRLGYDGRAYYGWQRHGAKPTVQAALEDAVRDAFGVARPVDGSGRTDRGAHAIGQVASVLLPAGLSPEFVLAELKRKLPKDVSLHTAERVPADFHARDSALGKTYRYVIWNQAECPPEREARVWYVPERLDVEAMRAACQVLLGEHDFASFATKTNYARASTVRHIKSIELVHRAPEIEFSFEANGFLYKMVRNLVRALVKVGEGRLDTARLAAVLAARDRRAAPGTAPASGLFLDHVHYADS